MSERLKVYQMAMALADKLQADLAAALGRHRTLSDLERSARKTCEDTVEQLRRIRDLIGPDSITGCVWHEAHLEQMRRRVEEMTQEEGRETMEAASSMSAYRGPSFHHPDV